MKSIPVVAISLLFLLLINQMLETPLMVIPAEDAQNMMGILFFASLLGLVLAGVFDGEKGLLRH